MCVLDTKNIAADKSLIFLEVHLAVSISSGLGAAAAIYHSSVAHFGREGP